MDYSIHYDAELNTTELHCPQPIIKTKLEMGQLELGQILLVIASDPSFHIDCNVFIRQAGHDLLQSWDAGGEYYFLLRKGTK